MFTLHISSPHGVDAEFEVDSPALALDLALRSTRLGFTWHAESKLADPPVRLTIDALRHHAVSAAQGNDTERELLDQVEWQHELRDHSRLN